MTAPSGGLGDTIPRGSDNMGLSQLKGVHIDAHSMGKFGTEHLDGSGTYSTGYCAVMALVGGCVITDITGNGTAISGATVEVPEGGVIPCDMDSVTLSSGEALGFKRA